MTEFGLEPSHGLRDLHQAILEDGNLAVATRVWIKVVFPLSGARVPGVVPARCCRSQALAGQHRPITAALAPVLSFPGQSGRQQWTVAVVGCTALGRCCRSGTARTAALAPLLSFPPEIGHARAAETTLAPFMINLSR